MNYHLEAIQVLSLYGPTLLTGVTTDQTNPIQIESTVFQEKFSEHSRGPTNSTRI